MCKTSHWRSWLLLECQMMFRHDKIFIYIYQVKVRWITFLSARHTGVFKYFGWFDFNVSFNRKNHLFCSRLINYMSVKCSWNMIEHGQHSNDLIILSFSLNNNMMRYDRKLYVERRFLSCSVTDRSMDQWRVIANN